MLCLLLMVGDNFEAGGGSCETMFEILCSKLIVDVVAAASFEIGNVLVPGIQFNSIRSIGRLLSKREFTLDCKTCIRFRCIRLMMIIIVGLVRDGVSARRDFIA